MMVEDEMLALIIEDQDKAALDDYADARGIKLDRRKGFDKMLADFRAEIGEEPVKPEMAQPGTEDQRTSPSVDGEVLDAYASKWAMTVAKDVHRVSAEIDGTELRVTIVTRHGVTSRCAFLLGGDAASMRSAFQDIARQIG